MDKQQNKAFSSWAKFLNPDMLRQNLLSASLFLAAFEMLKGSIVDRIRDFYSAGWNEDGDIVDPSYQAKVLARDKSPLRASLLWLREMNVIDDADIATVDRIREHRNELAHTLMKYIAQSDSEIDVELLGKILDLLTKIDRWWILEVEIPTNPGYDGRDVDVSGITSGNMIILQMMIQVASGDESVSETYAAFMESALELGFRPESDT